MTTFKIRDIDKWIAQNDAFILDAVEGMQPVNAVRPSMARRNHAATDPCSENQRQTAPRMQPQTDYANSPRIALYRLCRIALYPPRATHCKSYMRPFQTV